MLSIIIPSYNSEKTILNLISSIKSNEKLLPPHEIILIDSSDDNTEKVVEKNFPEVKIIKLPQKTPASIARNMGIKNSKYDYILSIDSDCELVIKGKLKLEDFKDAIYGGFVYPKNFKSSISMIQYFMEFIDFSPYEREGIKNFVPGCIMLFKKKIGNVEILFSENSDFFHCEDIVLCSKYKKEGIKTFFAHSFGVIHRNREDFKIFKRHISNLGLSSGKIRKILNIRGSFLKKLPFLSISLIPYRFIKISVKLLKISFRDRRFFRGFLYLPLLIYFLFVWWKSFYRGLKVVQ